MRPTRSLPRSLLTLAVGLAATGVAVAGAPSVLSEGGANGFWRPAAAFAEPGVPPGVKDANEDVCVSVGYLIKEDGSTSEFAMLKSWTSKHRNGLPASEAYDLYARMAVGTLMQRKFVPAQGGSTGATPVYTAQTFVFSGRADADRAAIRGKCVIEDLPDFIAKAQRESTRKGLNRGQMERDRQTPSVVPGPKGKL